MLQLEALEQHPCTPPDDVGNDQHEASLSIQLVSHPPQVCVNGKQSCKLSEMGQDHHLLSTK
eukprot:Gb_23052 [translate_table: standard]